LGLSFIEKSEFLPATIPTSSYASVYKVECNWSSNYCFGCL